MPSLASSRKSLILETLEGQTKDKNKGKQSCVPQRFWLPRSVYYRWTHTMLYTYNQILLYGGSDQQRTVSLRNKKSLSQDHEHLPHSLSPTSPSFSPYSKQRETLSQHSTSTVDIRRVLDEGRYNTVVSGLLYATHIWICQA